ncbi:ABC transporter ATP-binding protein [Paenibacillus thalictri]|uniref:ABC transporter ATP-binding protein n=1 Tax=Paenibacillus thalictri TaxID=2527873 RepID=A0A4Q9DIE9_9BACL|nr:ABC transporter ATP-binding protein [Paenibacillus thalictri]TBL71061.1 ABC transporter ATP-binding protein [Paenibacillus thalictri]
MNEPLLKVEQLTIGYASKRERVDILKNIGFTVGHGETLGIVGESGCGKSLTSLAVMGLLADPLKVQAGAIRYGDTDLAALSKKQMNRFRGKQISMIFQEPMTSLNPVFTIGDQIGEAIRTHLDTPKAEVEGQVADLLKLVGIPSPEKRIRDYPHQLSGGMRQRAMIAMALSCRPKLLIADEPTTALDVTIQAQILGLLHDIRQKTNMSMMFITHDLGVLSQMADRIIVMYGGRIVETADMRSLFEQPLHPYTQGLWKAIPGKSQAKQRLYNIPGTVPDPRDKTPGCRFASRCPHAELSCRESEPPLLPAAAEHEVACFLYAEKGGGRYEGAAAQS